MYEIDSVRQDHPSTRVRWFTSAQCDLFIWKNVFNEKIEQFQFCFNKRSGERVVEWQGKNGFSYAQVDHGVNCAGYPAAPIVVPCDPFDLHPVLEILKHESGQHAEADIVFVQHCLQKMLGPGKLTEASY